MERQDVAGAVPAIGRQPPSHSRVPDVTRPILPAIVAQHIEAVADLRALRTRLVRAADVGLAELARHDERMRAHLDGLMVAGDAGYAMAQGALDAAHAGTMFTLAVAALERADLPQIDALVDKVDVAPDAERALVSAFGWVSATALKGVVSGLLAAAAPVRRRLGIAACVAHGVDPGPMLGQAIDSGDDALRIRALWAAGRLARVELLQPCVAHLSDPHPRGRLHAARSALFLGGGAAVQSTLRSIAFGDGDDAVEALRPLMLASTLEEGHEVVRTLLASGSTRKAIQAAGWCGDPAAGDWLLREMQQENHARLAGAAFEMILGASGGTGGTGASLGGAPPAMPDAAGAQDDGGDAAQDPDADLPSPNAARMQAWWAEHRQRFPAGTRLLVGEPAEAQACRRALRAGVQPQRVAAAELASLLQVGSPVFNTCAPAWRQARSLAAALGS